MHFNWISFFYFLKTPKRFFPYFPFNKKIGFISNRNLTYSYPCQLVPTIKIIPQNPPKLSQVTIINWFNKNIIFSKLYFVDIIIIDRHTVKHFPHLIHPPPLQIVCVHYMIIIKFMYVQTNLICHENKCR